MKHAILLAALITFGGLQSSLEARGAKRFLKKESAADLVPMTKVFIGWVDLEPEDWALHGYGDKKEWSELIVTLNRALLRLCQTKYLRGRTVVAAQDASDTNAAAHDLYIKFSDVRIDYNRYYLYLSIQFIDPKTKAVLGTIPMRPYYGNDLGFFKYLRAAMEEVAVKLQVEITGGRMKVN